MFHVDVFLIALGTYLVLRTITQIIDDTQLPDTFSVCRMSHGSNLPSCGSRNTVSDFKADPVDGRKSLTSTDRIASH